MSEQEISRVIAKNITKFLEQKERTQADLADYMEVSQATVSNWCKGIKLPRMDKIDKICQYFGIQRSDLMEEKKTETPYYINDDAREYAQFLFEHPEYRILFSAVRKVSKNDLETVRQIIDKFKGVDEE